MWQPPPPPQPGAPPPPKPPRTAPASTFAMQGRPAPGLYVLGWLLSGVGFVLLFVAAQAGSARGIVALAAYVVLLAGLSAAAGYQIIARAQRPPEYFRGPSPLICFGIIFLLIGLLGTVLVGSSADSVFSAPLFLVSTLVTVGGYLFVVWVYGFRSGAFDLRGIGLPIGASMSKILGDILIGAGVLLAVAFVDGLWGALLAALLGTAPPAVVPAPSTPTDTLYVVLGACVLVPIGEEVFFRGYSLTAWWRDLGERSALIRSTLFFAFVHIINIVAVQSQQGALDGAKQALFEVLVIAPVGLALGWLFVRRGLVASIAGHAAFNSFAVLSLILVSSR